MRYFKMNGCGNDFVIFDARAYGALNLTSKQAAAIAQRDTGVGCDQVIAMERSMRGAAFMRIWNADGGEVTACGNATRCVGWILAQENGPGPYAIETGAGLLKAEAVGEHLVAVDMGSPLLKWEEIPVARDTPTDRMEYAVQAESGQWFEHPGGVNMGNPHAVFFVPDAEAAPAETLGPKVENDAFFPERVNVGFCEVRAPDLIRLRVWERGAGLTLACGTGACAAVVAAHRAGLTGRSVEVIMDGGRLNIDWRASDDRVIMTGPVVLERMGELVA
jgi:diaminopimelate epimerase